MYASGRTGDKEPDKDVFKLLWGCGRASLPSIGQSEAVPRDSACLNATSSSLKIWGTPRHQRSRSHDFPNTTFSHTLPPVKKRKNRNRPAANSTALQQYDRLRILLVHWASRSPSFPPSSLLSSSTSFQHHKHDAAEQTLADSKQPSLPIHVFGDRYSHRNTVL